MRGGQVMPVPPGSLDEFFRMADKIDHPRNNPIFIRADGKYGLLCSFNGRYDKVSAGLAECDAWAAKKREMIDYFGGDSRHSYYRRLLRWRLSRSTLLVLGMAQGWGQVKLWLTLLVAWTGWPVSVQWVAGTLLAVVITVACFRSTEWAVRRWGPEVELR